MGILGQRERVRSKSCQSSRLAVASVGRPVVYPRHLFIIIPPPTMYHMHRPLKNQRRDFFFSLGHLFHFLEMEQLSLYTFLPTFRSTPGPSRVCCRREHSVNAFPLPSPCIFTGNVLSPSPPIQIFSSGINNSHPVPSCEHRGSSASQQR